jgi:transposase
MRCAHLSIHWQLSARSGSTVGKNTFHVVGLDKRGAIVLQQKVTRHQLGRRLSNIPRCLIGMETCSGTHFIARQLTALGHDVRLIPAQYVKPFLKGHKNDYRDAEAIAEAVQRPTMHFVSIKTPEQMDLLALHRVRSRLVRQRTGVANQIRGFLLERGVTVRQGLMPLRKALPEILSSKSDVLWKAPGHRRFSESGRCIIQALQEASAATARSRSRR